MNEQENQKKISDLGERARGQGLLIAMDGPSGVGKSTISRQVAKDLELAFLETGAMYRALTWACLKEGVDVSDGEAVAAVGRDLAFSSAGSIDEPRFQVGDVDVTAALRSDAVAEAVSTVSAHKSVRDLMVSAQRDQMLSAREEGVGMVAEGRDITTVVCPDADVLVLLQADPKVRLARRVLETHGEITEEKMAEMADSIHGRDQKDSLVTQFETAADGVTTIDSTDLSIGQVMKKVYELVDNALSEKGS